MIFELLTPVALAHWIMTDGCARPSGLILCTDSFTLPEVIRLMNVLMVKYQLNCTLPQPSPNQYRIYIRESSMSQLRSIVLPYMVPSMLYKIGL